MPVGVAAVVVMVSVPEQVGLQELFPITAEAPEGKPLTASVTGCVAPDILVRAIVLLPELPCITVTVPLLDKE